jgi:microbial collagenase
MIATCYSGFVFAANQDHGLDQKTPKQAPMPHERSALPPSLEQKKFNLPLTNQDRVAQQAKSNKLAASSVITKATTVDCKDMNKLATYSGAALADYIVNLPDYSCHYGLFVGAS